MFMVKVFEEINDRLHLVTTDSGEGEFFYPNWDNAFEDAQRMYNAATSGVWIKIYYHDFEDDLIAMYEVIDGVEMVDYEAKDGDPF